MEQRPQTSARVLLVEDERLAMWLTRKCLEDMGCSVTEADGCAAAEERLATTSFDLVVLDYRLGDGLGVEILRRMRVRRNLTRAILLTAEVESISESLRRELAMDAVLAKPLDVAALRAVVGPLLKVALAAGRPADASATVGRFSVVTLPAVVTAEGVRGAAGAVWLALDLRKAERMEPEAIAALVELARACREGRGRLCVILTNLEIGNSLKAAGADREFDLLDDVGELDPAGRRLSAGCERSAELDAPVRRVRTP